MDIPVAMEHLDVDKDGYVDLLICYNYGNCITNCSLGNFFHVSIITSKDEGKISWLKNPGNGNYDRGNWTSYLIGNLMATHRFDLHVNGK